MGLSTKAVVRRQTGSPRQQRIQTTDWSKIPLTLGSQGPHLPILWLWDAEGRPKALQPAAVPCWVWQLLTVLKLAGKLYLTKIRSILMSEKKSSGSQRCGESQPSLKDNKAHFQTFCVSLLAFCTHSASTQSISIIMMLCTIVRGSKTH